MRTAPQFQQVPPAGATAVIAGAAGGAPFLSVISGPGGVKDGGRTFLHSGGSGWARPEDITVLPSRMVALMDDVYEGLRDFYPDALADAHRGAIYLAAADAYRDTGSLQADYEVLRDAVEAEARRVEAALALARPGMR